MKPRPLVSRAPWTSPPLSTYNYDWRRVKKKSSANSSNSRSLVHFLRNSLHMAKTIAAKTGLPWPSTTDKIVLTKTFPLVLYSATLYLSKALDLVQHSKVLEELAAVGSGRMEQLFCGFMTIFSRYKLSKLLSERPRTAPNSAVKKYRMALVKALCFSVSVFVLACVLSVLCSFDNESPDKPLPSRNCHKITLETTCTSVFTVLFFFNCPHV